MLGKLIKHEFRATGRLMLPMLMLFLAMAVINCTLMPMALHSDKEFMKGLCGLFVVSSLMTCAGIAVAGVLILINRFRRHVLGNEGYTTMTLPVSVDAIICSKLIVSLVWYLVFGFITAVSLYLNMHYLQGQMTEMMNFSYQRVPMMPVSPEPFQEIKSMLFLLAVLLFFFLKKLLRIYASLVLGNMFRSGKLLISVVIYAAFSVISMIGTLIYLVLIQIVFGDALEPASNILADGWFGVLQILVPAVILYLITSFTLRKNLNLG